MIAAVFAPATAADAALSEANSAQRRGKRGTSRARSLDKEAAPSSSVGRSPYLVTSAAPQASGKAESQSPKVVAIDWQHVVSLIPPVPIVASASLTTDEQTPEAMRLAWDASADHAHSAALFEETNAEGGHAHLHGPLLFATDESAALFAKAWRSAAGGSSESCVLKELGGLAAFLRTGNQARPTWEAGRGFGEHAAAVLRYATKNRGALVVATGVFAALLTTRTETRRCACGCGRSLEHLRRDARAFDGACRRRVDRARKGKAFGALPASTTNKRGTCDRCFGDLGACDCSTLEDRPALDARGCGDVPPVDARGGLPVPTEAQQSQLALMRRTATTTLDEGRPALGPGNQGMATSTGAGLPSSSTDLDRHQTEREKQP